MSGPGWLSALRQDLRFAARMIAKRPGFSAAIVLTVAIGIGANTALFSVIRAVLLRPLSYTNPQQLVIVSGGATPIHVDELRTAARSYTSTGVYSSAEQMALTSIGAGEPEVVSAQRVSANFLDILGVAPIMGRSFLPAEDRTGGPNVVMISARLWRRHFGGNPAILGHTATLAGAPYTIVGILPPRFAFPSEDGSLDVWITRPLEWSPMPVKSRPLSPYLHVFGRLKPDVSVKQASAELATLNHQYAAAHPAMLDAKPDVVAGRSVVKPLQESVVADVRTPLLLLAGAVGLLLLIVCANVASLLLARAATRAREFAVRAALGAGRNRLLRQLLTESTLLSVIGGALGVLLAWIALRNIRTATALELPRSSEIHLDLGVLAFALTLSVLTGIVFGLAPALSAFRRDLAAVLQGNLANSTRGRFRRHLATGPRGLLVAGQVALSLVLLVSAGLMMQSLAHLYEVDPGFSPDHVLTMSVSLSPTQYDTDAKRAGFFTQLVDRVEALPGVENASLTLTLPTAGWAGTPIQITGRPEPPLNQRAIAVVQLISPDYFRTLQIPLKRGRAFTADDKAGAPGVAIIDESLARRFWPQYPRGDDPIGQHLLVGSSRQPLQIVGIAADVYQQGRDTTPMPGFYLPNAQQPPQAAILALRTKSDPAGFTNAVRHQVLALDHNQPISEVKTLDAVLDASESQRRLMFSLLAAFSAVATLLAMLGLYSVISYSVVERTREIAIRQALGAQRGRILALVLRQGLSLALGGIVLGVAGAAGLTRLLTSLLFGVKAIDPVTFMLAAMLFLVVALAASYIPARRAAVVEPMAALRDS